MKKYIGLMVMMVLLCFASMAMAAKSEGSSPSKEPMVAPAEATCAVNVIGTIMSIDRAKNQIVVKDQYDKINKTIVVKPREIAKIKVGDVVRFILPASNVADNLGVLKPDEGKKGKK